MNTRLNTVKFHEVLNRICSHSDADAAEEMRLTEEQRAATGYGAVDWATQLTQCHNTDHPGAVY